MAQTFVRLNDDSAATGKKEDHSGPLPSGNIRENVVLASPTVDANVIEPATSDPSAGTLALPVRDLHTPTIDTSTAAVSTVSGTTADAAVTGDNTGTIKSALRGLGKLLADVWSSGNHWLQVSIQNALLSVQQLLSTAPVNGQTKIAVTGTAVQLGAGALTNGVIVTAKSTNAAAISVGGSSVNNTVDGTGNGYILEAGASASWAVSNANQLWVNGTTGDIVSWAGS